MGAVVSENEASLTWAASGLAGHDPWGLHGANAVSDLATITRNDLQITAMFYLLVQPEGTVFK